MFFGYRNLKILQNKVQIKNKGRKQQEESLSPYSIRFTAFKSPLSSPFPGRKNGLTGFGHLW
jgi:hypothetical protein